MHNLIPIYRDLCTLRTHILNSLQDDHSAHWRTLVSCMDGARCRNHTQFWHMVHKLKGCQRERFEYLLVNGDRITNPDQVTNTFQTHWHNSFQPHPLPLHEPSIAHIHHITDLVRQNLANTLPHNIIHLTRLDPQHPLITPIEEEDVARLLRHTPRRAPGPSGVTWPMVRSLPPEIISSLTKIFNACLASGYFPKAFKISNITLIAKPGKNSHLPENYRPISLLEILGKTFERLINLRLRAFLECNGLLAPQQFGFRRNASTEDALNP